MGNMEKRIDDYWSLRAEEFSRYRILDLAGPVRMYWHEFFKKELPELYSRYTKPVTTRYFRLQK